MTIVKWSFHTGHQLNVEHPECMKNVIDKSYKPFVPLSSGALRKRKDVTFVKCPAVTDFMKSTYVLCSPIDLNFEIEISNSYSRVFINNISQEVFDSIIDTRFLENKEKGQSPYPVIGIDFLSTFTSDEPVMLQVLPAFLHYNDFTSKTTVIPGEYDISKWVRPVELVFEVKEKKQTINIRKGDALSYFKFNCKESIKLEPNTVPWTEINACNDIRNANTFRPLKERYKSYEEYKNDQS